MVTFWTRQREKAYVKLCMTHSCQVRGLVNLEAKREPLHCELPGDWRTPIIAASCSSYRISVCWGRGWGLRPATNQYTWTDGAKPKWTLGPRPCHLESPWVPVIMVLAHNTLLLNWGGKICKEMIFQVKIEKLRDKKAALRVSVEQKDDELWRETT